MEVLCPYCQSTTVYRSRVRWYERLRKTLSLKRPYRCRGCGRRYWYMRSSISEPNEDLLRSLDMQDPSDLSREHLGAGAREPVTSSGSPAYHRRASSR